MNNKKYYFKVFGVLIFAFVIANMMSTTVFMAKTPRINKFFLAGLANLPNKLIANLASVNNGSKKIDRVQQNQAVDQMKQLPASALNSVAPGVYAKDDENNNIIYIRITKDAQWEERTVNVDGREMKLRFPKGTIK